MGSNCPNRTNRPRYQSPWNNLWWYKLSSYELSSVRFVFVWIVSGRNRSGCTVLLWGYTMNLRPCSTRLSIEWRFVGWLSAAAVFLLQSTATTSRSACARGHPIQSPEPPTPSVSLDSESTLAHRRCTGHGGNLSEFHWIANYFGNPRWHRSIPHLNMPSSSKIFVHLVLGEKLGRWNVTVRLISFTMVLWIIYDFWFKLVLA